MDLRLASLALVALIALAPGCSYRAHVGAHDAGITGSCTVDSDCAAGNQCACGRCITLDLLAPACDPGCDTAEHGDFCTVEGRRCPAGPCSALVCTMGVMQLEVGTCTDGGPWCECAPPPPGCYYENPACPCSDLVCPGDPCGPTTCGEGTVCCNAGCGICAPPGVVCSAEVCAPDCSPQDARGDGACARSLGIWAWNGAACRELSGCSTCVGADCANTFATQVACEAAFSECDRSCGGRLGDTCGPGEYCDFADPHLCGAADEVGVCRLATGCTWESRTVCGCNGITYLSPCDAYHNGVDVLQDGACESECEPDDARGSGACDLELGVVWTGTRCEYISGCSCEGTDCETIRRDQTACNDAHADCIVPHG